MRTQSSAETASLTRRDFENLRRSQLSLQQMIGLLERCIFDHVTGGKARKKSSLLQFYDAYFKSEGLTAMGGVPVSVAFVSALDELSQLIPDSKDHVLQKRLSIVELITAALLWENKSQKEQDRADLDTVMKGLQSFEAIVKRVTKAARRIGGVKAMVAKSDQAKKSLGLMVVSIGHGGKAIGQSAAWLTRIEKVSKAGAQVLEDERRHCEAIKEGFRGINKFHARTREQICELIADLGKDKQSKEKAVDLVVNLICLSRTDGGGTPQVTFATLSEKERTKTWNASRSIVKDQIRKMLKRSAMKQRSTSLVF